MTRSFESLPAGLLPRPRSVRLHEGVLRRSSIKRIVVPNRFPARLRVRARSALGEHFSRAAVVRESQSGPHRAGDVWITCDPAAKDPQAYRLTIGDNGVVIHAGNEAGAWYGMVTLGQMSRLSPSVLPACTIDDRPAFTDRGFMLDISRCKVPTMHTLRHVIDLLASLKYNQLQLYTEHTFAFPGHEDVWRGCSPMTGDQVRHLDRYCRERFIELVPNLNSFGHYERWLKHPRYRRYAECPDGFVHPLSGEMMPAGSTLYPSRESLALLDSLYGSFLPHFTSGMFNVGCDETWELGKGRSARACRRKGCRRVYLDFVREIYRLVRKRGRRMMFWGDIILRSPDLIAELPRDVVALNWGYEASHPFDKECARFQSSGIPFYVCPGTSSWNSLIGRTDNWLGNLSNAARRGLRHGARGYLVTDWGDGGHHQYLPISYPGMVGGAACAWRGRIPGEPDLARALDRWVLDDRAGVLGETLLELGRVHRGLGIPLRNKTAINELLFADGAAPPGWEGRLSAAKLKRTVDKLEETAARVSGGRPGGDDGDLVMDEIAAAAGMARHALRYGLYLTSGSPSNAVLCRERKEVIKRHHRLWKARNRAGGLAESSGRLRKGLRALC